MSVQKRLIEYRYSNAVRSFFDDSRLLTVLGLLDQQILAIDDSSILQSQPCFVTGFSENHLDEAMANVLESFFAQFRSRFLFVYDLSHHAPDRTETLRMRYPFVRLRKFDFSAYPHFVQNILEYRWKPLIIAELLRECGAVVWMDSSIVWRNKNVSRIIEQVRMRNVYPLQLPLTTGHSIFAATHREMYEYFTAEAFSSNRCGSMHRSAKDVQMFGSGLQIVFGTTEILRNIVRWSVLCALERNCMAPRKAHRHCTFARRDHWREFADCHRYDQSALNLLLWHSSCYNATVYHPDVDLADVRRWRID